MKNSILAKAAALLMAASLTMSLVSCGDSDSSEKKKTNNDSDAVTVDESSEENSEENSEETKEITGETKTWGVYTVLIPEGWTLRQGDALDENDENYCSVKKSDFSYFDLKNESEEVSKKQYEYNKKTYTLNQKDIPATKIGDIEWNGFEYGNELNKGFELYATVNGKNIRVSSCGFGFDSAETKAVLGSLKIS